MLKSDLSTNIRSFILQSNSVSQNTAAYINYYRGLNVYTSFGFGNTANVTWISFTGENQTTSKGIYPVILYYRKRGILLLAYGISATTSPDISWGDNIEALTIKEYFKQSGITSGHDINKYKESLVYKGYLVNTLNTESLVIDLDTLIDLYKERLTALGIPDSTPFSSKNGRWRSNVNTTFNFENLEKKANISIMDLYSESTASGDLFSLQEIVSLIDKSGLQYSPTLIKRLAFSLMTKPFVILSGLAGSGKTQLAIAFAKVLISNESQLCIVPVGADWTNREPLLGYPNALAKGEYVFPESKVLQLLIEANKEGNRNKPYFLILDEMNMSYVERYFADFLSSMESHEEIHLWNAPDNSEVPSSIPFPSNLFIIGTINVDETTYMFSPKVLDRANVLEFKITEKDMGSFLGDIKKVDVSSISGKASKMSADFVAKATTPIAGSNLFIKDTLVSFFALLKSVNAEFGYRSATEIFRFYEITKKNDDESDSLSDDQILDCAIIQKLLPKLHGSRKKLSPVLKQLWTLCGTDVQLDDTKSVPDAIKFPLSAEKILRMYQSAVDNGFTSFPEA